MTKLVTANERSCVISIFFGNRSCFFTFHWLRLVCHTTLKILNLNEHVTAMVLTKTHDHRELLCERDVDACLHCKELEGFLRAFGIGMGAQYVDCNLPVDLKSTVGRLHDTKNFGAGRRTCRKNIHTVVKLCCAMWAHVGMQGTSTYITVLTRL